MAHEKGDDGIKKFTWRQLCSLNKPENAHVAYNGKVYDVSSFVSSHPGGIDQIMLGAGHDITPLFNSYHQPQTIKILEKYYVGELVDNEMPVYAVDKYSRSQFYATVKKRVKEHFESLNIDPKFDFKMFLVYFFFCSTTLFTWYGMLLSADFWICGSFFAALWSISTGMVVFTLGHDSGHFCITHNPTVWRIARIIVQSISGISIYCWTYQHTYGHHGYTNVDGADPDIRTSNDLPDMWRIKNKQSWYRRYRLQHLYMPLLYLLFAAVIRLQDFSAIKALQRGTIRMNPPSAFQWREFYFIKAFHFVMKFVVPPFYMSLSSMLLYNITFELILGYWLATIAQTNHVTTDVSWIEPDEDRIIHKKPWAEYQVLTTKDYATDSWLCTLLTGALNHQVAHHLFPDVLQSYYPLITPIVRETCAEFGIKYHCETNALKALLEHLKYLYRMGQDPTDKVQ